MFGLKYLSREKKLLLQKLQDRVANNQSAKERGQAELAIQELLSEAKPYLLCDRQEAQELREQLLGQIRILEGLGKYQSAESFRMHLKEVEFHIQHKTMEAQMKEEAIPVTRNEPSNILGERLPSINALEREKRKKKAIGRARWTIDMDEDSDEPSRGNE